MLFTGRRGHAKELVQEAVIKSPALIIAAGGDGRFNEVVNGLAGSEIPVAILPLGTTNVLAKELNIPEDVDGALEAAIKGNPKTISLGKITATHPSSLVTRYFVLMAGIGFDGEAIFNVNETLKKLSGKGSYIYSGIKTLSGFKPGELICHIDGKTFSGYTAIIGKASKYGGHYMITPDVKLTDPFLSVCLLKGRKRFDILRYVFGIIMGRHLRFQDVVYTKATMIEVDGSAHVQIDGDYFGKTRVKIEIAPNIVRLMY